ncbi:MAG: FadR/GntR family transcriptional regulator [Lachnospirales bacterium]
MATEGNRTLPEKTADIMLGHIARNKYKPGDKIPNEFELAKQFGVGRSTVREAIRLLVSRNVLVVKRGSGTYVADNTGMTEDPLGLSFEMDKASLAWDLMNVRILLEPESAAWAALNATDEEIEEIKKQCDKVENLYIEGKNHMEEDTKFHAMIAKASHNRVMEKIVPIMNVTVAVFHNIANDFLKKSTLETHRGVVEAIARRDPQTARYVMLMHLCANRRKMAEIFFEKEKEE